MSGNVEILQVIYTRLTSRGDGDKEMYRMIDQYWTMDGELLFEFDPITKVPVKESLSKP